MISPKGPTVIKGVSIYLKPFLSENLALPDVRSRFFIRPSAHRHRQIERKIGAMPIGPVNHARVPVVASTNNCGNEFRGIIKRMAHKQKEFCPDLALLRAVVKHEILDKLEPLPYLDNFTACEEWLVNSNYGLKRQAHLRRLNDEHYGKPLKRHHLECSMFTKEEFYPEEKHPRMIVSRSDVFKSVVGPATHAIEDYVFHNSSLSHWFIKGRNPRTFPTLMEEIRCKSKVLLETDYSSFEGSFHLYYQYEVERRIFKHLLKNNQVYWQYIKSSYPKRSTATDRKGKPDQAARDREETRGSPFIRGKHWDIKLPDNRKSGEMWTSLMNGLSNLVNMLYLCHMHGINVCGLIEGDDGYFGLDRPALHASDYDALGFTIKMKYDTDPINLSFCCTRYNPLTLVPLSTIEPLTRVGWCCSQRHFKHNRGFTLKLYKSKLLSYYFQYSDCPVVGPAMYYQLHELRRVKTNLKFVHLDWWDTYVHLNPIKVVKPVISDIDRQSFAQITGIPLAMQLQLEKHYSMHPNDDYYYDFPETEHNLAQVGFLA